MFSRVYFLVLCKMTRFILCLIQMSEIKDAGEGKTVYSCYKVSAAILICFKVKMYDVYEYIKILLE